MEFRDKEDLIFWYLDKNYYLEDGFYRVKNDGYHEWGDEIITSLCTIFSFDKGFCGTIFKVWALTKGLKDDEWESSLRRGKLNANWSPEQIHDLESYGISDAEETLVSLLSEEISKEIDAQILRDLKSMGELNKDNFLPIMRCIGYEKSPTIYDPNTFAPKNYFWGIRKHEQEYERQNNTYWQDWVRTRG